MTTKINGTNTAANPAITGADTDTGLSFGTDTVNINTGGTTRATIDSSGALDVPTNFPIKVNGSEKLKIDTSGNLTFSLADSSNYPTQQIKWSNDSTTTNGFYISQHSDRSGRIWHEQGLELVFGTANAERMRIRDTGGLMINDNGSTRIGEPKLHVLNGGSSNNVASFFFNTTDDRDAVIIRHNRAAGGTNATIIKFLNDQGNGVGSIRSNGSSSSFITSSDYRLKENITPISDGITRLKTLKPKRFNFIADAETTVDGFLAHEVTAVPEAIAGTKDEVDSDNNPVYQGIDQSKLVPLLTAALQEAITKIETLETKVAALEAA